jgi:protein phosphatase
MMKTARNISVCVETHLGLKRAKNEDACQLVYRKGSGLDVDAFGRMFAVADGMGGHAGGEVASRTACEGLLEYYAGDLEAGMDLNPVERRLMRLNKVIWRIEKEIFRLGEKIPEYANMGTTLSVLLLFKEFALIAHVGDSRIYRFRNGVLKQLTQDETMAQLSLEMGYIKPEDVRGHPQSHVLIQALGTGLEKVNARVEKVASGDAFLLCSDGLYDMVSDQQIHEILSKFTPAEGACERLIKAALHNGGRDNVTAILVEVE